MRATQKKLKKFERRREGLEEATMAVIMVATLSIIMILWALVSM